MNSRTRDDAEILAHILYDAGWKDTGDAQWDRLFAAIPEIAKLCGCAPPPVVPGGGAGLARRIVERIFDVGQDSPGNRPHRMEYKIHHGANEKPGGGLCEEAMVDVVSTALASLPVESGPETFLKTLAEKGGCIVSSNECHEIEIADSKMRGDFIVDGDGLGYVRRFAPPPVEGAALPEGVNGPYDTEYYTVPETTLYYLPSLFKHGTDAVRLYTASPGRPVEIHPVGTRSRLAAPGAWEGGLGELIPQALAHAISDIENMEAMAETPQVAPFLHDMNSASIVLAAYRAALRRLSAPAAPTSPKVSGWQPMETAPRDGTEILAVGKSGQVFIVECIDGPNPSWYMRESDLYRDPVAWMPLPPPHGCTDYGGNVKGRDLTNRLAYTKPELQRVLPFGHTTIEAMIQSGAFPQGVRAHPKAHAIWPRSVVEAWLKNLQPKEQA